MNNQQQGMNLNKSITLLMQGVIVGAQRKAYTEEELKVLDQAVKFIIAINNHNVQQLQAQKAAQEPVSLEPIKEEENEEDDDETLII